MRFSFAGGRSQPFDRNPTARNNIYNAGSIGPHGSTTRWTYTVPTSKKAQVQNWFCSMIRQTVAGALGFAECFIIYSTTAVIANANVLTNAVGDKDHESGDIGITLGAGVVIEAGSSDASTGGTFRYIIAGNLIEFDA